MSESLFRGAGKARKVQKDLDKLSTLERTVIEASDMIAKAVDESAVDIRQTLIAAALLRVCNRLMRDAGQIAEEMRG